MGKKKKMPDLQAELNRLAGTTNLDAQGAANALAGTTGLDTTGALNVAAGTTGLELNGALKKYAQANGGDITLDSNAVLANANRTPISTRFAGFETGNFSELGMNQANNGTITVSTEQAKTGTQSAKCVISGSGVSNQYSRVGWYPVFFNPNDYVVYKTDFFFPTGFLAAMTNQTDLMRFDNFDDFPSASEQTGLTINLNAGIKKLYLFRNQLGTGGAGITYILGPYDFPSENAWHTLEVRQYLSDSAATNALYVDNILQGTSTLPNTFGKRFTAHRTGIVASGTSQAGSLTLYIDNVSMQVY